MTWNKIEENTASIVCTRRKVITSVRKVFMVEGSLLVPDKAKINEEVKDKMSSQKSSPFEQLRLIQYIDRQHPWAS